MGHPGNLTNRKRISGRIMTLFRQPSYTWSAHRSGPIAHQGRPTARSNLQPQNPAGGGLSRTPSQVSLTWGNARNNSAGGLVRTSSQASLIWAYPVRTQSQLSLALGEGRSSSQGIGESYSKTNVVRSSSQVSLLWPDAGKESKTDGVYGNE